jgi:hypothetical protein
MRNNPGSILANENGSALVISILVLVAMTAVAMVTIRISTVNLDQASNDKYHKMNFVKTDADTGLVAEMIEQTIEKRGLGVDNSTPPVAYGNSGDINVYNPNYHMNGEDAVCENNIPTETNRDIQVSNRSGEQNDTYIRVYGDRSFTPGSGIEIAAGYHGRGKGAASGGVQIIYTIRAYGRGLSNSQTRLSLRWRHVL